LLGYGLGKGEPVGHLFLRAPAFQIAVMTLLVFLGIMGLREAGYLERMELNAYDWSLRIRPSHIDTNPPITLVAITDQDIRELGHWPITDEVLANTLESILQHSPRAIGVDIYRDLEVPPGRPELNRVLVAHPEVVMIMKFGRIEKGGIPAPAVLRGTDRIGFSDMLVDADGVVRRGLLFLDDGTNFFQSFALRLALKYLAKEGIEPKPSPQNSDWVQLGQSAFRPFESHDGSYVEADAQGYQFLLDLERREGAFPSISLGTVLRGDFKPEVFEGRMVLIGVVAQGVKDYFYTSQCGTFADCPQIPGIELHGYAVNQLLRAAQEGHATITTFSDSLEAAWISLWVLAGGLIGVWVWGAWRFSLVVILGLLLLCFVVAEGLVAGKWIPFIPPALGWVSNAMVVTAWISNREKRDKRILMSLFSRHVSSEVAQAVWAQREQFLVNGRLRPQKTVVTTLFSDLEGFTTVAENMEPDRVLDWLNTYMEAMVSIINEYGGVVDDYHGDMIKADFGVFQIGQTEEHIRRDVNNAVRCALALYGEMRRLNAAWQQQGLPIVRMRIGIHTGPVVVGSLGSAQRLKFTSIGDTVNIASRLESFQKDSAEWWDKEEVCRILIGDTTKQYLDDFPGSLQEVGRVALKGKAVEVSVYKLCVKKGTDSLPPPPN